MVQLVGAGQDPALVDDVFGEVIAQRQDHLEKLTSERTRLHREGQQRREAMKRLIDSLGTDSPAEDRLVKRRVGELEQSAVQIDSRLEVVETELRDLRHTDLDKGHLTETLSQFTELWDVLYPGERCNLVRSLIQSVTYHSGTGSMQFEFAVTQYGAPDA